MFSASGLGGCSRRRRILVAIVATLGVGLVASSPAGAAPQPSIDNAPKLPDPYLNVFALNQNASNGVIHGITRVLIPVNIP